MKRKRQQLDRLTVQTDPIAFTKQLLGCNPTRRQKFKVGNQPVDLNFIKRREDPSLPWYENRQHRSHLKRSHHDPAFAKRPHSNDLPARNRNPRKRKPELEFHNNSIIQLRENAYKGQIKQVQSGDDQVEDIDEFPPTMPPEPQKKRSSHRAHTSSHASRPSSSSSSSSRSSTSTRSSSRMNKTTSRPSAHSSDEDSHVSPTPQIEVRKSKRKRSSRSSRHKADVPRAKRSRNVPSPPAKKSSTVIDLSSPSFPATITGLDSQDIFLSPSPSVPTHEQKPSPPELNHPSPSVPPQHTSPTPPSPQRHPVESKTEIRFSKSQEEKDEDDPFVYNGIEDSQLPSSHSSSPTQLDTPSCTIQATQFTLPGCMLPTCTQKEDAPNSTPRQRDRMYATILPRPYGRDDRADAKESTTQSVVLVPATMEK